MSRVFRHSSPVVPEDITPLTAEVDPTAPGYGDHLGFDKILRRCGLAWTTFLAELGGFDEGVIVPRLSVDYLSEVGLGTLDVDVAVLTIGRTSFTVRCTVSQAGTPAASVDVVLVSFGYDVKTALPLTGGQRAALEQHLSPSD